MLGDSLKKTEITNFSGAALIQLSERARIGVVKIPRKEINVFFDTRRIGALWNSRDFVWEYVLEDYLSRWFFVFFTNRQNRRILQLIRDGLAFTKKANRSSGSQGRISRDRYSFLFAEFDLKRKRINSIWYEKFIERLIQSWLSPYHFFLLVINVQLYLQICHGQFCNWENSVDLLPVEVGKSYRFGSSCPNLLFHFLPHPLKIGAFVQQYFTIFVRRMQIVFNLLESKGNVHQIQIEIIELQ